MTKATSFPLEQQHVHMTIPENSEISYREKSSTTSSPLSLGALASYSISSLNSSLNSNCSKSGYQEEERGKLEEIELERETEEDENSFVNLKHELKKTKCHVRELENLVVSMVISIIYIL